MRIVRIRVNIFLVQALPRPPVKPALAFAAPAALPAAALQPALPPLRPQRGFVDAPGSRRQHGLAAAIVALHLLGFWSLSQLQAVRHTVARVTPVVVRLMTSAEPPRPAPPPTAMPRLQAPSPVLIEAPVIAVAAAPAPSPLVAAVPPPPPPAAVPVQAAPSPVQLPPPHPALRQLPASAVRYLREPRMTVPLLSRRLKESGVVHLRVVVDTNGQPREITLARSSGFSRLDEQALQDMRSARFAPQTENGMPIEWEVIAPMSYEVDR